MRELKKLNEAIETWHILPNGNPKESAVAAQKAYGALLGLIDKEQKHRRNRFWPRIVPASKGIGTISDGVLAAHKGWALRVTNTADYVLATPVGSSKQDYDNKVAMLDVAKDYLVQNRTRFVPSPEDGFLHRLLISLKLRVKKVWAGIKARRVKKTMDFDYLENSWNPETQGKVEGNISVELFEKAIEDGAAALSLSEGNLYKCNSCRDDERRWIWGARWGSEDYPCPQCNSVEYEKWLRVEHPEEAAVVEKIEEAVYVVKEQDEKNKETK